MAATLAFSVSFLTDIQHSIAFKYKRQMIKLVPVHK